MTLISRRLREIPSFLFAIFLQHTPLLYPSFLSPSPSSSCSYSDIGTRHLQKPLSRVLKQNFMTFISSHEFIELNSILTGLYYFLFGRWHPVLQSSFGTHFFISHYSFNLEGSGYYFLFFSVKRDCDVWHFVSSTLLNLMGMALFISWV